MGAYIPWSRIHRALARLPASDWTVCNVLGVQQRSLASLEYVASRAREIRALRMVEAPGSPWAEAREAAVTRNSEMLRSLVGQVPITDVDYDMVARDERQLSAVSRWSACETGVLAIDISGLPERALFWAVRSALRSTAPSVLLTYCVASNYTGEVMLEVGEPRPVATFHGGPQAMHQVNVIGVGFNNPGLSAAVDLERDGSPEWRILMPQASEPTFARRNWEALDGARLPDISPDNLVFVNGMDLSTQVSLLRAIRDRASSHRLVMLPYGPKPLGAAMALVACETDSVKVRVIASEAVHFNPDYSFGAQRDDAGPVGFAYLLRVDGHQFA